MLLVDAHRLFLRETADGSMTLYSERFGETYHSEHGALAEARYVFVNHGAAVYAGAAVRILEYGLGAGVNFLATVEWALAKGVQLEYCGLELYPVPAELFTKLSFPGVDGEVWDVWRRGMCAAWGESVRLCDGVSLRKERVDFSSYRPESLLYDTIYFDAFSPVRVAEQWSAEVFSVAFSALRSGGGLVTYSASGLAKRSLRTAGFSVRRAAGALGKRHMLIAERL